MAAQPGALASWKFTRASHPDSRQPYFKTGRRQIAGQQQDFTLPWQDDMYLAYPSPHAPDWNTFIAYVQQLNAEAEEDVYYKIFYILRRAHKADQGKDLSDPDLDEPGKEQCAKLRTSLQRALYTVSLPPPEVIMTSPLARALRTTALGIAPVFPSVQPVVLDGLREGLTSGGKNKRHSKDWIMHNFPDFDIQNVDESDQLGAAYNSPGSRESYEAIWQRVHGSLAYAFEKFKHASVIMLMSHCYVEQIIQREIEGWDVPDEEKKGVVEFFVGEAKGYAILVKGVKA